MVPEKLGKTPKLPKTKGNKRQQPKWRTRIENQIKSMRADLSVLTDMAQKGESQKISKKKQRIKKKYKITANQELQTVRESLKMKIQQKPKESKTRYQLKNHLRKKQQKHFGVTS